jgi:DNA polymerase-3 subunit chi
VPASVDFHTGLADTLGYACRLLRKAHRQGLRVLVTAPASTLSQLDRELWVFEEREFVPHRRASSQPVPDELALTPIWLTERADPAFDCPVLVNLGAEFPAQPMAFERVVELVGQEPDEAAAGRERWRRWKALGLEPVHRNAAAGAG